MKKLLVTCRDIGAALHMVEFLCALDSAEYELHVIAAPPASIVFEQHGVSFELFDEPAAKDTKDPKFNKFLEYFAALSQRFDPDLVLIGASGIGISLDEAAQDYFSGRVPICFLQDGWGASFVRDGSAPDLLLVVLPEMVEHFSKNFGIETEYVGPLRYLRYQGLDIEALRNSYRSELDIPRAKKLCGFFGQPIEQPCYVRLVSQLSVAVTEQGEDSELVYFLHPAESRTWIEQQLDSVLNSSIRFERTQSVEQALSACDLALSAFSSSLTSLSYLQAVAPSPIGAGAYCFFEQELRGYFERSSKRRLPLDVELGYLPALQIPETLSADISNLLSKEPSSSQWESAKRRSLPKGGCDKMLEIVRSFARQ